jgi:hypothetical protein
MFVSCISDPFQQRIGIAFMFTGACWTLWWNIRWRRVMGFWLRPPYRKWVQWLFRTFFALCFLGSLGRLLQELQEHPMTKRDIGPTIGIAAIMCAVVSLMGVFGLWRLDRRDRKSGVPGERPRNRTQPYF